MVPRCYYYLFYANYIASFLPHMHMVGLLLAFAREETTVLSLGGYIPFTLVLGMLNLDANGTIPCFAVLLPT